MADTVRMLGKVLDRKENQPSGPAPASGFEPDDLPF
jgi:hypothetical protein